MHEDICTMALDKQTSFIILPFHRKWSVNGSVEAENNVVRNVNCSVLDRSPCSVGILIDRGGRRKPMKSSSYSVGILFLGGKDDREALTLAKRMARDPRVKLTVIRLIAYQDRRDVLDWDTIMDIEILKDVKQNNGVLGNDCDIMYVEQVSDSGSQTAKIIRSVADYYDLIIVGRRYGVESIQSKGLSEWSEFPELGIVGDLFASTDLDSRSAVAMAESLPPPYLLYENATYEFCFVLPSKVNSAGIWENATTPAVIFSYSLPFLELQFVMIFLVNHLVYAILRSIGITLFASQMFVC
ncbi:hypothetical protein Gotri_011941 [Gossypium trilobum]|uniref:Cation/H(+) antiporter 4-like n=1 Tax=Gossypium trilobum TaxID=34281 RepID=A0A7J9DNN7_9ROSI|nr:hypothetical protein [Gossypium trilobum]